MVVIGIVVALGMLLVGLYLLFGVAIIVTHLIEKRPLSFLVPAPEDDPEWSKLATMAPKGVATPGPFNPYEAPASPVGAESANSAAPRLGFEFQGLYRHAKGGTYKTLAALWLSPSRQTLAVVTWGTIASLKVDKTILHTALDDGRFLVTSEKPTGAETPGLYENLVAFDADFERLVRRHDERIRDCGRAVRPFQSGHALTEYHAILERRARFLVENGDAYFVDPGQSAICSTPKGALKAYLRTLQPMKYIERDGSPRIGPDGRRGPSALAWIERLCYIALIGGFVLNTRGTATTTAQLLFRLSLFVGGVLGLLFVLIAKAVLKKRSA